MRDPGKPNVLGRGIERVEPSLSGPQVVANQRGLDGIGRGPLPFGFVVRPDAVPCVGYEPSRFLVGVHPASLGSEPASSSWSAISRSSITRLSILRALGCGLNGTWSSPRERLLRPRRAPRVGCARGGHGPAPRLGGPILASDMATATEREFTGAFRSLKRASSPGCVRTSSLGRKTRGRKRVAQRSSETSPKTSSVRDGGSENFPDSSRWSRKPQRVASLSRRHIRK
jgi:hypothetical protein